MVKLNKIYTRTGDSGDTGLVGGERRAKCDLRVDAYGTVDEANAIIGIASQHDSSQQFLVYLKPIQHDLFDLGADLSTLYNDSQKEALRLIDKQVERLEQHIDHVNESLSDLTSFVLPGGSLLAAHLHHARTVVRRAERLVCALADKEQVNPVTIRYLNRLSDLLFVLARAANNDGANDVLWEAGINR